MIQLLGRRSSGYVDVDRAQNPSQYIARLDEQGRSPFWQSVKLESYQMLELRAGNAVIDVGCGTGDDVRALAGRVGPTGQVVGLDSSATMITEAWRRSRRSDLPVGFVLGDARQLEFPDEIFDGCRIERVLQHILHPNDAVAELARVTRQGGRVVAVEPDYGTLSIDGADAEVTQLIVEHRRRHFASGRVGRDLPAMFVQVGLQRIRLSIKTLVSTLMGRGTYGQLTKLADNATADGVVTVTDAYDWLGQLVTAAQRGEFRYLIHVFLVSGSRA